MSNEFRKYANGVGGIVEDNPLASGTTTLTSVGLAALPAVGSTEHMVLVFDPDGLAGAPEMVWVTAHTGGASTATIVRGKEGSTDRQHERDVSWVHAVVASDLPIVRSAEGTDGATRTNTVLGPWSTPWTLTIPVLEGQAVELSAMVHILTNIDDTCYIAFRRGSTTIYEGTHYTGGSSGQTQVVHHYWRDLTPDVGDIVYEVYVASNAQTATLKNGATLDTTKEATQGKSILVAKAAMR